MSKGYVYILSNPAMPGLYKIGKSIHGGRNRANEIYQTGVPAPFVVEFEMMTDDCEAAERDAHEALNDCRYSDRREFFAAEYLSHAIECVVIACTEHIEDLGEACFADVTGVRWMAHHTGMVFEEVTDTLMHIAPESFKEAREKYISKKKSTQLKAIQGGAA